MHYDKEAPDEHKKHYREYLKYVLQNSCWSGTIKTKSVSSAIRNWIELDCSSPRDIAIPAAIALRQADEFKSTLPVFSEARKAGLTVGQSHILSLFLKSTGKGYVVGTPCSSHSVLNSEMCLDQVIRTFDIGYVPGAASEATLDSEDTGMECHSTIADRVRGGVGGIHSILCGLRGVDATRTAWGSFIYDIKEGNKPAFFKAFKNKCETSLKEDEK